MFVASTTSLRVGQRPTRGRSLWIDVAPGVWEPHPVIADTELPAEYRHLTDTTPGAALAEGIEHALSDTDALDDAQLVDAITGVEHLARWAAGVQARLIAEFAHRRPGDEPTSVGSDTVSTASRWAPDELGLALERTRLDTKALIGRSVQLLHVLPDTLAALQAGTIDERRAVAICDTTALLPAGKARAVEAIVLPAAPGRTLRQLRDRLRRAVHRVDPDGEHRRHRAAHDERRVTIASRDEGMASLWLSASSHDAEAAFAMLTRLAHAVGNDGRTLDQRRSDIGIQLWQGRLTLTDLDDVTTAVSASVSVSASNASDATASTTDEGGTNEAGTVRTGTADTDVEAVEAEAGTTGTIDDSTTSTGVTRQPAPEPPESTPAGAAPQRVAAQSAPSPGAPSPGAACPESGRPYEQMLIDAVAAALARRPQVHETVRKPLIQVVVGLDTLTGESQRPAELLGHGPVDADTARALAADALWKRLTTDPLSGRLLDYGRTTYRPPLPLAEHVTGRDQYCRFPTCTRRVQELDHHERFHGTDNGPTDDANLNGYCRTHHLLKEHQDWHVLAHPDGHITWITPTGARHTSEPYDYRPFTDPVPDLDGAGPEPAADGVEPEGPDTAEDDDLPPF